ncbi:flavodoxin family protein [Candidatus Peregrinibacteria bacterium]|nr:flavodoxin family protein [Candidatus Peregrinibacteria bacterium]
MANILIIYGTGSGNTEIVAEKVAEILAEKGHAVCLQRVEESKIDDIEKHDVAVFACPTYDEGLLFPVFEPFAYALEKTDLKGKKCAVIGLGDVKYNLYYHLESAYILENIVKKAGGALISPALMISGTPIKQLNKIVKTWAEKLADLIK